MTEYDVWWRVEIYSTEHGWEMDADHDTEEHANEHADMLRADGEDVRVRKMRGQA